MKSYVIMGVALIMLVTSVSASPLVLVLSAPGTQQSIATPTDHTFLTGGEGWSLGFVSDSVRSQYFMGNTYLPDNYSYPPGVSHNDIDTLALKHYYYNIRTSYDGLNIR
jgi:hypothetical protein